MIDWVRKNASLLLTTETPFSDRFCLYGFCPRHNPEVYTAGGEKWMEMAFINAILHSPTFPPHDPWLSGYAISYYYFGYVMSCHAGQTDLDIGACGAQPDALPDFRLSAIGAYGLLYNLLSAYRRGGGREQDGSLARAWRFPGAAISVDHKQS